MPSGKVSGHGQGLVPQTGLGLAVCRGVSTQTAKAWREGRQSSGKGGWRGSHSSPPTKLPQHPSAPPGCRAPFLRRPKEGSTEADIPPGETPGYTKGQTGTASPRGPGCRGVGPGWAPGSRNREGSASQGGNLPPLPRLQNQLDPTPPRPCLPNQPQTLRLGGSGSLLSLAWGLELPPQHRRGQQVLWGSSLASHMKTLSAVCRPQDRAWDLPTGQGCCGDRGARAWVGPQLGRKDIIIITSHPSS